VHTAVNTIDSGAYQVTHVDRVAAKAGRIVVKVKFHSGDTVKRLDQDRNTGVLAGLGHHIGDGEGDPDRLGLATEGTVGVGGSQRIA
jgi:hypothetical protein